MTAAFLPRPLRSLLSKVQDCLGLSPWAVRPGGTGSLRIPPAEETRASVARFRESAERYFLLDFARDRFVQSRFLLAAARLRKRRRRK
ncbi:MAG: hypothetical protein NTY77_06235 [Elusimicrobia bacterium]|nr:hypothetical protein [Elusimicrobiota bacterium]